MHTTGAYQGDLTIVIIGNARVRVPADFVKKARQ